MEPRPEIRAALLKLYVQQLRAAGAEACAAMSSHAGPEVVAAIDRAGVAEWLPLAFEVALAEAWARHFGVGRVRALGQALAARSVGSPVFRPMIEAALSMLGPRPEVLAHIGAAGWQAATRHAGRSRVARVGAHGASLVIEDAPAELGSVALLERMAGSMEWIFDRAGRPVRAEPTWPDGGSPAIRLDWS